jgi:hypothetical protein
VPEDYLKMYHSTNILHRGSNGKINLGEGDHHDLPPLSQLRVLLHLLHYLLASTHRGNVKNGESPTASASSIHARELNADIQTPRNSRHGPQQSPISRFQWGCQ